MKLEFDLDNPREALNAISIISSVHPGMLEHVLKQLTEPQPVEQPAPQQHEGVPVAMDPVGVATDAAIVGSIGEKTYTQADVNAAVQAYANVKDVPAAMALLKEFGVSKATQLKPEQFAAFIARTQS